jgi:hypothetical protein
VNTTPTITIYTRHSAGCKYANDEFAKRCDCRKWLRWSHNGVRHRRKADTRSWAEAERVKRDLEDQLTGRNVVSEVPGTKNIRAAIDVFLADKKVEGISTDLMRKYERGLNRLAAYCDSRGVYTLAGIDREFITRSLLKKTAGRSVAGNLSHENAQGAICGRPLNLGHPRFPA